MARLPRWSAPGHLHQVLQRGVAGSAIFRDAQDHADFLDGLRLAAAEHRVAVHAYALLPDRIHLLATPQEGDGLSRMMQAVGRRYVLAHNRRHGRAGTLWDGRFRATVIEAQRHWLACRVHVELAPVRAGLVSEAVAYPWSSAAHHAGLRRDVLVTVHPLDWQLGNTPFEREVARNVLLDRGLAPQVERSIDEAVEKGWALGEKDFVAIIEERTGRRAKPVLAGRPAVKFIAR